MKLKCIRRIQKVRLNRQNLTCEMVREYLSKIKKLQQSFRDGLRNKPNHINRSECDCSIQLTGSEALQFKFGAWGKNAGGKQQNDGSSYLLTNSFRFESMNFQFCAKANLVFSINSVLENLSHSCNIISIYQTKNMCSKLKWSEEEEQMLRKLANLESKRKWVEVANKINSLYPEKQRTSKQCREKYINHVQYGSGIDNMKWTEEEEHTLFERYLERGSQWKLISSTLMGKSQNAVKNKFYGKVRKLVRKLNNICRERINRSNKPLRDESIMRIIDINQGFENLPQHLIEESQSLKNQLIFLAEKDMADFESWSLIDQDKVVNLIRKIHKFNINSRYYCSRKRKNLNSKKCPKQIVSHDQKPQIEDEKNEESVMSDMGNEEKLAEAETLKIIPFVPIIVAGVSYDQTQE